MKMTNSTPLSNLTRCLAQFHGDEDGVAMTEYILIFSLITFGGAMALIATAAYVKAYRDFLVWWLAHPAV